MRIKAEKNRSCLALMSRFIWVCESHRNVQTQNDILKFLLLLAMVNIIISLFPSFVFLKQLIIYSSFLVINFFSITKKSSTYIIFCCWKILITATPFLKHWIIYNWINFSRWYPCCETNFGKTKNLKNSTTLLCKRFLRIISVFFKTLKWLKAY